MRFSWLHLMVLVASLVFAFSAESSVQAQEGAQQEAQQEAQEAAQEDAATTPPDAASGTEPDAVPEPDPAATRTSTSLVPTGSWEGTTQSRPQPAPEPEPEPRENPLLTSPLLLSLAIFTGPAQQGALDESLANFGYAPSKVFWGLDVSVEARVSKLLFIGVRGDVRMRQWAMWGGDSADAFGPSLLAVADLRLTVNRWIDFSGVAGAGKGKAVLRVRGASEVAGLPRLHAGLAFGLTIVDGFRVHLGAAFDYAESLAMNDFDHSVSFSVAAFRFGFEARL